ncbi:MAG: hypothetical protein JNK12_25025 [Acidimicrobiales bacterium]|nr:hypothetical protein [Acidimicrobiales bacterium]
MTRSRSIVRPLLMALLLVFALVAASCSSDGDDSSSDTTAGDTTETTAAASGDLVGTFGIDPGTDGAEVTGSYFRMVQSGGTVADGPFVPNGDSTATDQTYTLLEPGTDGGLTTGAFQPGPDPLFDADGNALADAIIQPVTFFGVSFSITTSDTDPESGDPVTEVTITDEDGTLTGQTTAVTAAYGGQEFNQGAPKPDGSSPGETTAVSGTYDAETGAYTLDWASQIVGGSFDGFTGVWHLEGTFTAA